MTQAPRTRIKVETLVSLLGVNATFTLCLFGGGRRVPRPEQFQRWQRRVLLFDDWLNRGYSPATLAAKYRLSIPAVKKIVTSFQRQVQAAKRAQQRGNVLGKPPQG
jgi:Mor family transcriptional regulator